MSVEVLAPPIRPGSIPSDLGFCLDRLFDTENYDHIDIERQLAKYTTRDLRKSKLFVTASRIFGSPNSRNRIIVAPPMEKVPTSRCFTMSNESLVSEHGPSIPIHITVAPKNTPETNTEIKTALEKAKIEVSKFDKHKKWINERKMLRESIENLGLSEEWLMKKPDKTPLERRVLHALIDARTPREVIPEPDEGESLLAKLPEVLPSVHRPAPLAFRTLAKFIKENNLRLIDMFKSVDKDKDWSLSRAEFKQMIKTHKIPISDILLEELMLALDSNLDDEIQYMELSKGLEQYKVEERQKTKEALMRQKSESQSANVKQSARVAIPPRSASDMQNVSKTTSGPIRQNHLHPNISPRDETHLASSKTVSAVSWSQTVLSPISSRPDSPSLLEPPPLDLRDEQMILSSDEAMLDLRKRDRVALARAMGKKITPMKKLTKSGKKKKKINNEKTMVKTGVSAVDDHMRPSTLIGEVGDMVDKFRQLKYKEYTEILKLCQEKGLDLDEKMLERVLLYPPDKPHSMIRKKIRIPGTDQLPSSHFADPPAKPKTPMEVKHKDRIKKSKSGQLLIDSRHVYPDSSKVAPRTTKMYLSSGRAFVRRKVDCWMTFEDYDHLTSNFAIRYKQLHGAVDDNAFWPGHLLNKLRLCMDDPAHEPGSNSIFRPVRREKKTNYGYDNDLNWWPIRDDGGFQCGNFDFRRDGPP